MSIKQVYLSYKDEKSDKVYKVEIVYLNWDSYQVNFAYGKQGSKLKTGTKTANPVSWESAKKIFDELVKSKEKKGYKFASGQDIYQDNFLKLTLSDRQEVIDKIKQKQVENFLEEVKKAALDPREYWAEIDLSNVNLSHADLRYCNLYKTNLIGANLTGANLQGVILEESQIDETTQIEPKWRLIWTMMTLGGENQDLRGIDISGIEINFIDPYDENSQINLTNANLEGANLSQTDLSSFNFSYANLKNANLSGSKYGFFNDVCLENANLRDTEFDEGYFSNAVCIHANFSRASFAGEWVDFHNANCKGANFQSASFTLGNLNGADFSHANFTNATRLYDFFAGAYEEPLTQEVNLNHANFSKTDLRGVDFSLIGLINLKGVRFDGANLTQVNFSGLDLSNCSFRQANLTGAHLENCNLTNTDFTGADTTDIFKPQNPNLHDQSLPTQAQNLNFP